MAEYQSDILDKARDLKRKHKGQKFNPNFVTAANLRKIAERFTSHRLTNVPTIKSIKRVIQYMIAAKMVGDRKLYTALNDYTEELLDNFCTDIEIADDCGDGFDTAVERHVFRANEDVYELLKNKRIRYIDAGLVKYGGTDIFIPSFNALVHIVGNKHCLEEINEFIKNTPKEDQNNDTKFSFTQLAVKDFIVMDGGLRVTLEDSDPVELGDVYVDEYIVDEETDPDKITIRMFDTSTSKKGSIKSYRSVPLNKLKNGDRVMIKNGIVYHDDKNKVYKIIGQYDLIKLIRYEGLNQMSIVYSYPGLKGEAFIDKINLGNLNKHDSRISFKDWSYDYGDDKLNEDYLYLFKGKTKIGEMKYRETVTFEDIKNLLDTFV